MLVLMVLEQKHWQNPTDRNLSTVGLVKLSLYNRQLLSYSSRIVAGSEAGQKYFSMISLHTRETTDGKFHSRGSAIEFNVNCYKALQDPDMFNLYFYIQLCTMGQAWTLIGRMCEVNVSCRDGSRRSKEVL